MTMPGSIIQELHRILQRQKAAGRSAVWLSPANREVLFRPTGSAPSTRPPVAAPMPPMPPRRAQVAAAPVTPPPTPPATRTAPAKAPPAPPKPRFAGLSWDELAARMAACQDCDLSNSRSNMQFGRGATQARVMFIADYPSKEEDASNDILTGPAGELLANMIRAMSLEPGGSDPATAAYITHVLKCRLGTRRYPTQAEVRACLPCLWRQIELCQPQAIVLLGMLPLRALFDPAYTDRHRHQWLDYNGIPVMPTLHPNEILRMRQQPKAFIAEKRKAWTDLQQVMAKLGLQPPTKK
ncbi:MAG: uracil-DNA glycosylase [Lentisphaerae bacterium]|jgi:uracil-DNA glycosylase family 4|nr:uracil-DNA glycosylase [Lentisphaerota bacterium]